MKYNYWHITGARNSDKILSEGLAPSESYLHSDICEEEFRTKNVIYLSLNGEKNTKLMRDFVYLKESIEHNNHYYQDAYFIPGAQMHCDEPKYSNYVIFKVSFDRRRKHMICRHDQSRVASYTDLFFWNNLNPKYLHRYKSKEILITPEKILPDRLMLMGTINSKMSLSINLG